MTGARQAPASDQPPPTAAAAQRSAAVPSLHPVAEVACLSVRSGGNSCSRQARGLLHALAAVCRQVTCGNASGSSPVWRSTGLRCYHCAHCSLWPQEGSRRHQCMQLARMMVHLCGLGCGLLACPASLRVGVQRRGQLALSCKHFWLVNRARS
jgi:hypothetical protein